jgi:Ca-activated chloride channel family protein
VCKLRATRKHLDNFATPLFIRHSKDRLAIRGNGMRIRSIAIAYTFTILAGFLLLGDTASAQNPATIMVLDGSGSMWGRIDGRPKLEIARETAARVLGNLPPSQKFGLLAYGHRSRGDCKDIELMVRPATGTSGAILSAIKEMKFQGKTPLTEAVRQAAQALRSTEEPATVVLITDGLETCEADPCALAAELEKTGVNFTAHVIGFGLSREEGAKVACIAERTGGRYMEARNADSLADALASTVIKATPPPAPKTAEAPPPVRHRHYGAAELARDLTLTPTGGNTGKNLPYPKDAAFPAEGTIAQCKAICEKDKECGSWRYEPKGSHFVDHARCFVFSPSTEFSGDPINPDEGWASGMKLGVLGLLRPYVPLGAKPDASLQVRESVAPGAEFTVLWKGPANQKDWVDIVRVGHQETSGELAHFYVNETIEDGDPLEGAGTLKAPNEAGEYELRYILGRDIDRRVLTRVPLIVGGPGGVPATPAVASPARSIPDQKQGN